ncbi:MAG: glutamate racemase [Candidatus Omnitrophica bacterium]|nr:glutamate racemase [Candidatus Omnitrophota bacterium]
MPKTLNRAAIGVFDSGLGGLTVVKELIKKLPHENIIYFGDTARVPYGTKSKETIIRFSKENVELLNRYAIKMVVVACNSSSSYAIPALQQSFDFPILGVILPGAKKACERTGNGKIGVIATSATVQSGSYQKTIRRINPTFKVYVQACPLFVPLVEEGWLRTQVTFAVAQEYLKGLKDQKIDTLILGCTHYPLLKNVLKKEMGADVTLIDSADVVAQSVKDVLEQRQLLNNTRNRARYSFLISDRPQEFIKIAKNFLGRPIDKVKMIKSH